MDLAAILPQPVPVQLGERAYLVSPLRLADLARLQGWIRLHRPCPVDWAGIAGRPEGSEGWRRLVRDGYLASRGWPERVEGAGRGALLGSAEGLRYFVATCLAEHDPGAGEAELDAVMASMTVAQFDALERAAMGGSPLDELARLASPDSFAGRPGAKPLNWAEVLVELVERTGWTFAEVGALRLPQLAAIRTRGKAGPGACGPPPGMTRGDWSRRQRAFFGPDKEEGGDA